jgi:Mce-associated membrane protein
VHPAVPVAALQKTEPDLELGDMHDLRADDDDDTQEENDAPAVAPEGRIRRLLHANFRVVLLAVVATGLAAALILTMLGLSGKDALTSARTSALQAARTYAVEIGGYNYQNLNQSFGAVESDSTPSFRSSYSQASGALKTTLLKYHAIATATVVAAGLQSATANNADALVFLDQTVKNSLEKGPTTDRSQVEINLVYNDGKWLINNVTLL